jgi:poly(3-hydroxybutyrate) depolymerase
MRSLFDTIERLATFRARQHIQMPAAADDRLRDFPETDSNPGALRARIYMPPSLTQDAALVVVLHGCTIGPSKPGDQQTASRAQTEAFCNGSL